MAKTNMTIRIDPEIKKEASELFRSLGLDLSTATDIFYRQALRASGIPFEIKADRANTDAIPEQFQRCFWDVKIADIDLEKNRDFVITRIMKRGGISGLIWITAQYTSDEIRETAKRSRNLDPILANYLRITYNIPKNEMKFYTVQRNNAIGVFK